MINTTIRKLEKFRYELMQLVVEIEKLDIKSALGRTLLFERRLFILMFFDRLTSDRAVDIKKMAKLDRSLGRQARMFFTNMQLVSQSVKEFYLNHQENSLDSNSDISAESQRLYALLVYSVGKHDALISRVRHINGKSQASYTCSA